MKPGVYLMNFGGLSLAEAWRFSKEPFKFVIALVLKVSRFKGPPAWLPPHECEAPCTLDQLSLPAQQLLLPEVQRAQALGYSDGEFNVLARNLDPNTQEGFSYVALHQDRIRSIFLGYISSTASGTAKATVSMTGSVFTADDRDVEFVNHRNYLDGGKFTRKVKVAGPALADIDQAMQAFLMKSGGAKQHASFAEFKKLGRAQSTRLFDARIERGLYVFVRDQI